MRQRITYLIHNPDEFDPSQLHVKDDSFTLESVNAAKEHRLTFSLSELPQELYRVLRQCHELHIRWVTETPYASIPPFVSRLSPGLHAFFTSHKGNEADLLCPLLKKVFGDDLKCESPKDTFIGIPTLSERFSMSSASQYYQILPSLKNLITYIQQKICTSSDTTCHSAAASLLSAAYLDIDYDTISHALVLNAFWACSPTGNTWTETILLRQRAETIEVGVLGSERAVDEEDLAFSGFLTVIGEDSKPKPTRFSFPSRHHPLPFPSQPHPLTYTAYFTHPTGLHPTLHLTFPSSHLTSPDESCALHTYLILPSTLFMDKYQLSDPLLLSSLNLASLRSISGATDLEAPDWVVSQWGSAALLELAVPSSAPPANLHIHNRHGHGSGGNQNHTISIPLHLRYLPPSHSTSTPGLTTTSLPWPAVFWACRAEEAGAPMSVNPFDRVNLGYEGLFGPKTMFYHVPPSPGRGEGRLVEEVQVPVLDMNRAGGVEWGTVVVVLAGVGWVVWKLVEVVFVGWRGMRDGKRKGEGKKVQ